MKKLLLLCVPLIFSCDNKKEEIKENEQKTQEEVQNNTKTDTTYKKETPEKGTYIFPNGDKYVGEYMDEKRQRRAI